MYLINKFKYLRFIFMKYNVAVMIIFFGIYYIKDFIVFVVEEDYIKINCS